MRITAVIHSLDGGGAERVLTELCNRLAIRGHQVLLLTLDSATNRKHAVDAAVRVRGLNVMSTDQHRVGVLRRLWRLRRALIDARPDVVLSFCDVNNVAVLAATIATPLAVVAAERSDPARQRLGRTWQSIRWRVMRRAAAVTVLHRDAARFVERQTGRPAVVIGSAIERPSWFNQPSDRDAASRVVAIGRLEREKGFDRLIAAMAELADRPWRLVIAGDGSLAPDLEQQTAAAGLANRVDFVGWVSPWDVLAGADLFVLPSRYEGFPSAMLEAMAAGVPVVATEAGAAVADLIRQSGGWPGGDSVESLTKAIGEALADRDRRVACGHRGREVARRYAWPAMVDAYVAVLTRSVRR